MGRTRKTLEHDSRNQVTLPPLPYHWLVDGDLYYRFQVEDVCESLIKLDFGVKGYVTNKGLKLLVIGHRQPKKLTFWLMQNDGLVQKLKLKVYDYTYNTRKNRLTNATLRDIIARENI